MKEKRKERKKLESHDDCDTGAKAESRDVRDAEVSGSARESKGGKWRDKSAQSSNTERIGIEREIDRNEESKRESKRESESESKRESESEIESESESEVVQSLNTVSISIEREMDTDEENKCESERQRESRSECENESEREREREASPQLHSVGRGPHRYESVQVRQQESVVLKCTSASSLQGRIICGP